MANEYKFFGEDINSYITYASITNQFLNCKLKGIFTKKEFTPECFAEIERNHNIMKLLNEPYEFYQEIKKIIQKEYYFTSEKRDYKAIFDWSFKRCRNMGYISNTTKRKEYLLHRVRKAIQKTEGNSISTEKQDMLYEGISYFTKKIYSEIKTYKERKQEYLYILRKIPKSFTEEDYQKFTLIEDYITSDEVLNYIFSDFKTNIMNKKNVDEKIKSLIRMLRNDFLILDKKTPKINIEGLGKRIPIKKVLFAKFIYKGKTKYRFI